MSPSGSAHENNPSHKKHGYGYEIHDFVLTIIVKNLVYDRISLLIPCQSIRAFTQYQTGTYLLGEIRGSHLKNLLFSINSLNLNLIEGDAKTPFPQNIRTKLVSEYDQEYHNHKLQTTPWHREKEPHNNHETPGRQTKQSNQLFFLIEIVLVWFNVIPIMTGSFMFSPGL